MMHKHPLSSPVVGAGTALTGSVSSDVGVRGVEEMPVNAVRLGGLEGTRRVPVAGVLKPRGKRKVALPDAVLDLAEVVDLHTKRDVTERKAVGVDEARVPRRGALTVPEVAVALGVATPSPKPAIIELGVSDGAWAIFGYMPPEAYFDGDNGINAGQGASSSASLYNAGSQSNITSGAKTPEPLVAVAERISKANPAAGRALQTAADRRRYARRMAGWPEEKGN